jgi:ketosteroid isomerase-like protein
MRTKGTEYAEQETNVELVKKGYEAFTAGDVETVMSLFDDDIEWSNRVIAISGTYRGKAELLDYLGSWPRSPRR